MIAYRIRSIMDGILIVNNFTSHDCREGDISSLEVDAVTNTTDETLTEKNIISNRIFRRAGPSLHEEILNNNRGNALCSAVQRSNCHFIKVVLWLLMMRFFSFFYFSQNAKPAKYV